MKTCKKCGEEKEIEEFSKDKYSADGFTTSCKMCRNLYKKENKDKLKIQAKEYRENNSEKLKNDRKIYYKNNKKEIDAINKKNYLKNKKNILKLNKDKYHNDIKDEKFKEIRKIKKEEYKKINKEKNREKSKLKYAQDREKYLEKNRLSYNENMKNYIFREKRRLKANEYRKNNIERLNYKNRERYKINKDEILKKANKRRQSEKYKLKSKEYYQKNKDKMREKYNNSYNKYKYRYAWRAILKRTFSYFHTIKYDKTINILGYSAEDFKKDIESKFTENMSWDNYGEWHIDHIRSIATFDSTDSPSDVNSLSNLRPMWATTRIIDGVLYEGNLNKGKKFN
jgi:hypothetical protein